MAMAIRPDARPSTLNSIRISRVKGVEVPLLRVQLICTLPKAGTSSSGTESGNDSKAATKTTAETDSNKTRYTATRELTPEQQRLVEELKRIDQNVRAHEQAHMAAGRGVVTSGANYTYTYGPDGKQYAVGGEVGIDTSAERKPEANIDKGIRIQAAALAPRDPSPQDYRVAAIGSRLETQGRVDLRQQEVQQAEETAARAQAEREAAQTGRAPSATNGDNGDDQTAPVTAVKAANASNAVNVANPATEIASQVQQQQQNEANREVLARAYAPEQAVSQPVTVSVFA